MYPYRGAKTLAISKLVRLLRVCTRARRLTISIPSVPFPEKVIVGQSIGLLISTAIADVFTAQSFSFVLVLTLMLFGEELRRGEGEGRGGEGRTCVSCRCSSFIAMPEVPGGSGEDLLGGECDGHVMSCVCLVLDQKCSVHVAGCEKLSDRAVFRQVIRTFGDQTEFAFLKNGGRVFLLLKAKIGVLAQWSRAPLTRCDVCLFRLGMDCVLCRLHCSTAVVRGTNHPGKIES